MKTYKAFFSFFFSGEHHTLALQWFNPTTIIKVEHKLKFTSPFVWAKKLQRLITTRLWKYWAYFAIFQYTVSFDTLVGTGWASHMAVTVWHAVIIHTALLIGACNLFTDICGKVTVSNCESYSLFRLFVSLAVSVNSTEIEPAQQEWNFLSEDELTLDLVFNF